VILHKSLLGEVAGLVALGRAGICDWVFFAVLQKRGVEAPNTQTRV